ncbi:Hypothetical predicted protein [Paramuricea clavata]|nr:Hypothetical predicted protein [Paramuricea clavata]
MKKMDVIQWQVRPKRMTRNKLVCSEVSKRQSEPGRKRLHISTVDTDIPN